LKYTYIQAVISPRQTCVHVQMCTHTHTHTHTHNTHTHRYKHSHRTHTPHVFMLEKSLQSSQQPLHPWLTHIHTHRHTYRHTHTHTHRQIERERERHWSYK